MSDDQRGSNGTPKGDRINVDEYSQVRDWARSLGISEQRLRDAVQAVGNSAEKVRAHLRSHYPTY